MYITIDCEGPCESWYEVAVELIDSFDEGYGMSGGEFDCPRCGWEPSSEKIEGLIEKACEPFGGLL